MHNLLIFLFLTVLISGAAVLIIKKWVIPLRGWIQLSMFIVGEIALICRGAPCEICPFSLGICPVGTMQRIAFIKHFPFYIVFFLIAAVGLLFGSLTCAWGCPIGFAQDVLRAPKIREIRISNKFAVFRYAAFLLGILLIFLELRFNFFSKRGISVFNEIVIIGGGFLLASAIFIKRPFCRIFCPLGLIYGKFNKISPIRIVLNKKECSGCQKCKDSCIADLAPLNDVNGSLCVKCFNCASVCKQSKKGH